jgi:hypothetical protein
MWFSRFFKRQEKQGDRKAADWGEERGASINQGIYYVYVIVGLQILFVFGIMAVIMFIGKVISTPGWVFMAILLLFAGSIVYIYRKAKRQLMRFRESLNRAAGNNYEISVLGGMLTLRIEQNLTNAPKLLEAPSQPNTDPIIDAETIASDPGRKTVHLS